MLRILQKYLGVSVVAAGVLSAQGQQKRSNQPPPAPDQAAVDRGHALFGQTCGFCHGKEGNGGDGGPDLIRSVLVNHDENGELIAPVILNGRPDKGMPKFSVTTQQISDVAAFLRARNRYVRYRQLYQVKADVVTGDAKAGENYFKAKCADCHSPAGDLAHLAAKYEPEALMTRFLYPAGRRSAPDPKATATVDVKLASGQSFSGPLKHLDEFTVSMYDAAGDYHTWPLEKVHVEVHDPLAGHLALLPQYSDEDMHNILAYLVTLK